MQGEDNLFYTYHNLYGKNGLAGAIFLDGRNDQDLSNNYNIIYGHNLANQAMLGSLEKYREQNYYSTHRSGIVVSNNFIYDLTAFAVVETNSNEMQVYTVGNRVKSIKKFLKREVQSNKNDKTKVVQYDKYVAESADRVVALSTCFNGETRDRIVVFFKMTVHDMLN